MASRPKILFYVQHLLGIGHVKRASLLVKAWRKQGLQVTVVSGGEPVPQFDFGDADLVQLPPIKAANADFSGLVDVKGNEIGDDFKNNRRRLLVDALHQVKADILVVENYPFGRRQLRWELDPLLDSVKTSFPNTLVISSIRDILQVRKKQRIQETVEKIDHYFDRILVHGDEDFIPLLDSFSAADEIAGKLIYTGYVMDPKKAEFTTDQMTNKKAQDGTDEVIVSAGGGAVGQQLMQAALTAKNISSLRQLKWRFLLGPNVTEQERSLLRQQADANSIIESVRPDFPELLQRCRLSISQAGYNTIMDIFNANCQAVLVPFEGVGETEQLCRTQRLNDLGLCTMVRESQLNATNLAAAIDRATKQRVKTRDFSTKLNLDGAEQSGLILQQLWQELRQKLGQVNV